MAEVSMLAENIGFVVPREQADELDNTHQLISSWLVEHGVQYPSNDVKSNIVSPLDGNRIIPVTSHPSIVSKRFYGDVIREVLPEAAGTLGISEEYVTVTAIMPFVPRMGRDRILQCFTSGFQIEIEKPHSTDRRVDIFQTAKFLTYLVDRPFNSENQRCRYSRELTRVDAGEERTYARLAPSSIGRDPEGMKSGEIEALASIAVNLSRIDTYDMDLLGGGRSAHFLHPVHLTPKSEQILDS